jgi:hypothetical protein
MDAQTPAQEDTKLSAAFSDLEPYINDIERAVRIVEILVHHDAHEAGFKHEMLSLVAIEDLRTRSQELVKLYYQAYENEKRAS